MNKIISLSLALIFALVGLLFLFFPAQVIIFFNTLSSAVLLPPAPVVGTHFYLTLAVAYMYLVTLLALLMSRHPGDRTYPSLLAHGKFASAVLSLALFVLHEHYLIYLANGIVDGLIGALVLLYFLRVNQS